MNGLSPETLDRLKQKIRAYRAAKAAELQALGSDAALKPDPAFDVLYPETIDRYTFRQAWQQVLVEERTQAPAPDVSADVSQETTVTTSTSSESPETASIETEAPETESPEQDDTEQDDTEQE